MVSFYLCVFFFRGVLFFDLQHVPYRPSCLLIGQNLNVASRTLIIEIAGKVTVIAFKMAHLDQDMSDSLLREESQSINAEPNPNSNKE